MQSGLCIHLMIDLKENKVKIVHHFVIINIPLIRLISYTINNKNTLSTRDICKANQAN